MHACKCLCACVLPPLFPTTVQNLMRISFLKFLCMFPLFPFYSLLHRFVAYITCFRILRVCCPYMLPLYVTPMCSQRHRFFCISVAPVCTCNMGIIMQQLKLNFMIIALYWLLFAIRGFAKNNAKS